MGLGGEKVNKLDWGLVDLGAVRSAAVDLSAVNLAAVGSGDQLVGAADLGVMDANPERRHSDYSEPAYCGTCLLRGQ